MAKVKKLNKKIKGRIKPKGSILDLFKIMQLTRSQPQYGYVLGGLKRSQLSYLAEHHYLVTFTGWQLSEMILRRGGKINPLKVIELCMVHDLGELFGGDIGMPYARRNPKAKELSRKFEEENAKFLSQYFLEGQDKFNILWKDVIEAKNDESAVAKIADLLETFCFKDYNNDNNEVDRVLAKERFPEIVKKIKNPIARKVMSELIADYNKNFSKKSAKSIISGI